MDPTLYRPAPGSVPDQPGVYRFLDVDGRVIYVGKAKSLRSRLAQYFQDPDALHARTRRQGQTGKRRALGSHCSMTGWSRIFAGSLAHTTPRSAWSRSPASSS